MRAFRSIQARAAAVLIAVTALAGCGGEQAPSDASYTERGDLGALQERGRLRILVERWEQRHLPRAGYPIDAERRMAERFARDHGLEPELVYVDGFDRLVPALLAGEGDIIAANLTATEKRRERLSFTVPLDHTREVVVTHPGTPPLKAPEDLAGRTLAVKRGTSFWRTGQRLAREVPDVEIAPLPSSLSSDAILARVATGDIDYAIQDANVVEIAQRYDQQLKIALALTEPRPLAWGVRPDSPALLGALNAFLHRENLVGDTPEVYRADLAEIRERNKLRVLMRNNAASYFMWRGELLGFEYELARKFADELGVRLEVVVAPRHRDLLPMLEEGRGDLVAAFLRPTPERRARGVTFTRAYHRASEVLVARADDDIEEPQDLGGRTVVVRESSSYWESLEALRRDTEVDFELQAAPETMETERIIAKVAAGDYDLTVADSHLLALEMTWRDDVRGAFSLAEPVPHGWVVREADTELLAAANTFIDDHYRGVFYNITYKRYFETPRRVHDRQQARLDDQGEHRLSPYDDLVRHYADKHGFDWRLIVAQMYQESRFDPQATSWAGAKGLMQIMPRTAQQLGFEDLEDPETGIRAGLTYMDWVRERFPTELSIGERTWLALAAYNAGHGHVRDARRLAKRKGWNPDRWFDNVERAMLLLGQREYARKARHGYVRGREPVHYVREIRARYDAYVRILDEARTAAREVDAPGRGD